MTHYEHSDNNPGSLAIVLVSCWGVIALGTGADVAAAPLDC